MRISITTLRYVLAAIVLIIVLALVWWYFYLQAHVDVLGEEGRARGLNALLPRAPGGSGSTYSNLKGGIDFETESSAPSRPQKPPQLWNVSRTPTAGMGFEGVLSTLLFAERGTGYVFEANPGDTSVSRVTNQLFPNTYEALFAGRSVILISLDEDDSVVMYSGTIVDKSATTSVKVISTFEKPALETPTLPGAYLSGAVLSAVTNGRELFLLTPNADRGVDGIRSSFDGKKRTTVFSSKLSNWKVLPLDDGRMFLVQKASDTIPGFAYELKGGGTLEGVVRNMPGLTFLPKSGSRAILYGEASEQDISIRTRNGPSESVNLPITTVADKCVWDTAPESLILYCAVPLQPLSPGFLGSWYRGTVHTNDAWWRIDAQTGDADLIYAGAENLPLDVEHPVINKDGTMIAFINARDTTLWLLRLSSTEEKTEDEP